MDSPKIQTDTERLIDPVEHIRFQMADLFPEPALINGAKLLQKHNGILYNIAASAVNLHVSWQLRLIHF